MFKKLAASLCLLAVLLALVELGARLWLEQGASDEAFLEYASYRQLERRKSDSDARFKYSPHRYLGYYPTPRYESADGRNRHNALGFRGDDFPIAKPAGQIRIACLGGSTTYTTAVEDHTLSFPAQLEGLLRARGHDRVHVVNAGAGGWSSWESLLNLQLRVLELEPDVVIVYHGVNDVHPRFVWPPGRYRSDNSGRRAPNAGAAFMPPLLEHSALYRILAVDAGWMTSHVDIARTLDRAPASFHQDTFKKQTLEGTYPSGIFAQVPASRMLSANPPVHFRRNLEGIVHVARGHGIVPVLATFAHHPGFPREVEVATDEYRRAYVEMNAVVREICDETDGVLYDFAREFPRDASLYVDGRHVNVGGARKKAALFADFLAEQVLDQLDAAR